MAEAVSRVILLVDDDPFVRESTATLLAVLRYAVIDVANGGDAVALARDGRAFDAALVDWHMPGGLDGVATVRALRAVRPGLPFILVTGDHTASVPLDGELAGGRALAKPFRLGELRDALATLFIAG